jgi:hypothetical protein
MERVVEVLGAADVAGMNEVQEPRERGIAAPAGGGKQDQRQASSHDRLLIAGKYRGPPKPSRRVCSKKLLHHPRPVAHNGRLNYPREGTRHDAP